MFGTLGRTNRRVGGRACRRVLAAIASVTAMVVPVVAARSAPSGITAGPDGAMWFTNANNNSIGRIAVPPE